jgi:hypothetical protein
MRTAFIVAIACFPFESVCNGHLSIYSNLSGAIGFDEWLSKEQYQ